MPDDSSHFTAPKLPKRADNTPTYAFWCVHCNAPVDGYVIADIDHPTECMSLNVYCHDKAVHIGIQDVEGFRRMMFDHLITEDNPSPEPYKLFHPNDFKVDNGTGPYPTDDPTSL